MELLTSSQVAKRLLLTEQMLRVWRKQGTGPPYFKLGHHTVRYSVADLEIWLAEKKNTNETTP